MQQNELIPHLFRTEYSKIVAVLCNLFNLGHIEVAEDIASETFLKATETWGLKGVPENPTAWLYTVAKNKTKDYFKHNSVFEKKVKVAIKPDEMIAGQDFEFDHKNISDSQLAMIFAVCNPSNSPESQICLALQILCGFSVEEIASAFLTKSETIKKRLHRARANLRNDHFQIKILNESEVKTRMDAVLKCLYLLFNEGYFSKTSNQLIRKDLCSEAIRLTSILTDNPLTNTAEANALLALFCFQSSRLDARTDGNGEVILFDNQDRNLWNKELIEKGNFYLVAACNGPAISKYHLEAAIAYWHATTTAKNKWSRILELYNQLLLLEYSPIVALNRTYAFGKVYGCEKAIKEAERLDLNDNYHFHSLLGYLYSSVNIPEAIWQYEQAIALTKSRAEQETLSKEIERLNTKGDLNK